MLGHLQPKLFVQSHLLKQLAESLTLSRQVMLTAGKLPDGGDTRGEGLG